MNSYLKWEKRPNQPLAVAELRWCAVVTSESEKGGMNQSTVSFARVPRGPGWFAAGRGNRGGKRKATEVPLGVTEGDFDLEIARKE